MSPLSRNQPCPCGSGKKYKKCCLAVDEAAARAQAAALVPEVLPLESEIGYNHEEPYDQDDDDLDDDLLADLPALTAESIRRVTYTRGFITGVADLRRGTGVEVTDWAAPDIPEAVIETLLLEDAAAVSGWWWGFPGSAEPAQVDVIDVQTDAGVLSVQVWNRAVTLIHSDPAERDEIESIFRMCETLRRVAAGEPEPLVRPPDDEDDEDVTRSTDPA